MNKKNSFRAKIKKSLAENDISLFQSIIQKKLNEKLNQYKIKIVEEMATENIDEMQIVNQLRVLASNFGCLDNEYEMGTFIATFNNNQAISNFCDQLDKIDGIDSYEISDNETIYINDPNFEGSVNVRNVIVYFDLDKVLLASDISQFIDTIDDLEITEDDYQIDDDDDDDDDDEDLSEEKECNKNDELEEDDDEEDDDDDDEDDDELNEEDDKDDEEDDNEEDDEDDEDEEEDDEDDENLKEIFSFKHLISKSLNEEDDDDEDDEDDDDDDEDDEDDDDDDEDDEDDDELNEEDDDEDDEDEDEDDEEDLDESLSFEKILKNKKLYEIAIIKTAKWDKKLKKAVQVTKKVCPPGRTGPDCKTKMTADQKQKLRKSLAKMLGKMSSAKLKKRAAHAAASKAFIQTKNLKSISKFKKEG